MPPRLRASVSLRDASAPLQNAGNDDSQQQRVAPRSAVSPSLLLLTAPPPVRRADEAPTPRDSIVVSANVGRQARRASWSANERCRRFFARLSSDLHRWLVSRSKRVCRRRIFRRIAFSKFVRRAAAASQQRPRRNSGRTACARSARLVALVSRPARPRPHRLHDRHQRLVINWLFFSMFVGRKTPPIGCFKSRNQRPCSATLVFSVFCRSPLRERRRNGELFWLLKRRK